jgi:hypothetical protein
MSADLSSATFRHKLPKLKLLGWLVFIVGLITWLYGYFITGTPALVDWHAYTPWWIADCFPNVEAELGMLVMCLAMVPLYWPTSNEHAQDITRRDV